MLIWEVDTIVNDLQAEWKRIWLKTELRNSSLVGDPTVRVPGFNFSRALWTTLNRIQTEQGKCNYLLHKWIMAECPLCCSCGQKQIIRHINEECTLTNVTGGIDEIHTPNKEAID